MENLKTENVNLRDKYNRTLLHNSVFENRLDVVVDLLQRGADPLLTSNKGNTPLHTAASKKHHRIVETLLKYCNRDKLRKIIDAKTTGSGSTALHVAASNGCVASVRHLLKYGANFEVKNKERQRPIDVASNGEVKKILANVQLDWKLAAAGKWKELHQRMKSYSQADLMASIGARNNGGMTSLQRAVASNHCKTVLAITEARRARKEFDVTTKIPAEYFENAKKISVRQMVLMFHAQDVNVIPSERIVEEVAEILAAAYNIVKIADEAVYLPDDGEPNDRLNILDIIEETLEALEFKPEHVSYDAAGKMIFRGHKARYYKMLRIYDGDDEDYDAFEDEDKIVSYMAILQVAIMNFIDLLLRPTFNLLLLLATKTNDMTIFEQCIDQQYIDLNIYGPDYRTFLQFAAESGNEKMVKALLMRDKEVLTFQSPPDDHTVLHLATNKGHVEIVRLLLQSVEGRELEDFVDMKTKKDGWTAVHLAVDVGRLDVLKCLLGHHATYDLKDNSGKTPAMLSENKLITGFLLRIDELFEMARSGDASLLKKLKALPRDELLAVGNARDIKGQTLGKIADVNGHRAVSSQVLKMVKDVTPAPQIIEGNQQLDEHLRQMQTYQLREILAFSRT